MKKLLSIFIIFSCLLQSCANIEKDEQTKLFSNYLKEFNLEISDTCIYIFLPSNQCKNCFWFDATELSYKLNNRIHFFSGFEEKRIINFKNFHFDKTDEMLGLNFIEYGNKIITCKNGNIHSIVPIRDFYFQLDSISKKNLR